MTTPKAIELCVKSIIVLLATMLAGCQTATSRVDENFGSSVRHVVAIQTAQPGQETPSLDGQKAGAALQTYRKDVANPEKVERDLIRINLGN